MSSEPLSSLSLKWMLIIVGFLAGMFLVGVQLLQKYGYVSAVNWEKLGNDTSIQIQHWVATLTYPTLIACFIHLEFLLATAWRWDS
ncbi:MAG: hypothetical protein WBZ36_02300 [Candidatus Nitrosopolaris sp.]